MFSRTLKLLLIGSLALTLPACGDDEPPPADNTGAACDIEKQSGCEEGLACEKLSDDTYGCFAPVNVRGNVFDMVDNGPVSGARVVARDANDTPVSGVVVTDADGNYELQVPVTRDANGNPVGGQAALTLRADATGYLTYPKAPRLPIAVDVSEPNAEGIVQTASTDIGLLPLQDATGMGSVSGKVLSDSPAGTLVVAGGSTGVADRDGSYSVFNVPAGSVSVSGYKVGMNIESKTANVSADADTGGVDLNVLGNPATRVSGKVEIVNPGNGSDTSVILALEDTFDANAARGEAPPGLRVGNVSGEWAIDGVPDGKYVILAAFENDFLTRDPSNIGGTDIVHITVPADAVVDQSFKVTGSLDDPSPTGEQVVSGTPEFTWQDDSSEDHYEIRVFDAYGTKMWEKLDVPGESGNNPVVSYAGPALQAGMLYQFRAVSIHKTQGPISQTEDLMGTFLYR